MTEYKKYEDIPQKYKFDLEDILDGKNIDQLIEQYYEMMHNEIKIKDSKYNSAKNYLAYLESQKEVTILGNKIINYLSNHISTNISDPIFNAKFEKLQIKLYEFSIQLGSEVNRIFAHEADLKKWIEKPEFKNYVRNIKYILSTKKHKLANQIEEFINRISKADISSSAIFSILYNAELNYGYAISKSGKKTKITTANRILLLKNKDEQVRKSTYHNWTKAYLQHKESFSSLLYQHIRYASTWAKERKYKSTIESCIKEDGVDDKFLNTLYESVAEHTNLFAKYAKLRKKYIARKYKKVYKPWDSQLSLVDIDEKYSIEQMQDLVKKALAPMPQEYNQVLNQALSENWVDYFSVPTKRTGAYSIGGSYGIRKKYILMNHDYTLRSVSTLAHELGHSLHSYYSDTYQPYNLSAYPIFLAEIASIFNELMLQDYLMENSSDEKIKIHLLSEAIRDFDGTVRVQTMWSQYEYNLYQSVDNNIPISTFAQASKLYHDSVAKFSLIPKKAQNKEENTIQAVIIPHYYYDFYVYKYAVGFIVANAFFQKYKQNGVQELDNYINLFLKAGDSDYPLETLKKAGIDLYNKQIYKDAFKVLKTKIDTLEKLCKKIIR